MITGKVTGDAAALLRLRSMDLKIREKLREAVTRGSIMLVRYVKEQKLSGQVLKNRTGTLRRKVNYRLQETPTSVTSSVGVKLSYAAAHEYGIDKVVTVRQHLRQIKQAFGRPISPRTITVNAHPMHMRLPERSYLRSSLNENRGVLMEMLRHAVAEATR